MTIRTQNRQQLLVIAAAIVVGNSTTVAQVYANTVTTTGLANVANLNTNVANVTTLNATSGVYVGNGSSYEIGRAHV